MTTAKPAPPTTADPAPSAGPTVPTASAPDVASARPPARPRRKRRVLLVLLLAVIAVLLVWLVPWLISSAISGLTGDDPPAPLATAPPAPESGAPVAELPLGGTTIFPRYRVVAWSGTPDGPDRGTLGAGPPELLAPRLERSADAFATTARPVQPAMELVVRVADGSTGEDGEAGRPVAEQTAWQYLAVARAHRQLLIIDVQPGSSDFGSVVRPWERILREPDVGLALDATRRTAPDQPPGSPGSVAATEVNETANWLAGLVRAGNLPQKLLVVHRGGPATVTGPEPPATPPELAMVQDVDTGGAPADRLAAYRALARGASLHPGLVLPAGRSPGAPSPQQTLDLDPAPEFIVYR